MLGPYPSLDRSVMNHFLFRVKWNFRVFENIGKLKQQRRRQDRHKFAFLTMKTIVLHALHVQFSFLYISRSYISVLVQSTTWNDLFRSSVDDESTCWIFFLVSLSRSYQFNSMVASWQTTWNNPEIIAETHSYVFTFSLSSREESPAFVITPANG